MAAGGREYVDDIPLVVEERLRAICLALPEAWEDTPWKGLRWRVRNRTFANAIGVDEDGVLTVRLVFRSEGDEYEMLREAGDPFFPLDWGHGVISMVLDERTDWDEVAELVTDSFCIMAPKKVAALVDRPPSIDI